MLRTQANMPALIVITVLIAAAISWALHKLSMVTTRKDCRTYTAITGATLLFLGVIWGSAFLGPAATVPSSGVALVAYAMMALVLLVGSIVFIGTLTVQLGSPFEESPKTITREAKVPTDT